MSERKTLLVNLYGGPGCGKSTICSGLFYQLKILGYNCEMALEFAKDKVWEESFKVLNNQIYVFGKQFHRLYRLIDKVDIIITDAPLLNSAFYGEKSLNLENLIMECRDNFDNIDLVIERSTDYVREGRIQTEDEAINVDEGIKCLLNERGIHFETRSKEDAVDYLVKQVISKTK